MKKQKIKLVAFASLLIMLLTMFTMPVMAVTNEKVILKKADKEFLIYYKDICNEEFEFAFSKTNSEEGLNFKHSGQDQLTENSLNVAYVDEALYDEFFKDNNEKAYIWIRDNADTMLVSAELIDLSDSLNDEMINEVNTMTIVDEASERITVDTTQVNKTNKMVDGVDTTVTTGKVVVKEKTGAQYSYQLMKASEGTEAKELFDLARALEKENSDTYTNLSLAKKFYDLYSELIPTEWTAVEDSEILQPESTITGDEYVLYIKEETDTNITVDAKFLTCVYEEDKGVDQKEETITEVVKLPVTFDSGSILFIILGIIVLALIVFVVIKLKSNKKDEK